MIKQNTNETWDSEVDVVIGGAGGAGLAAAIEASGAWASVLVFEKQATVDDSSTALCGGHYCFAGTDYQESRGVKDSNELLYKDLMEVGKHKNDPRLVQAYVDTQLDTYYWMKGFGVTWTALEALAGMSAPRAHSTEPVEATRLLQKAAEEKGAKILFETPISALVTDATGRVIGVEAKGKAGSQRVRARKGVVLATGGFGRDMERLKAIDPGLPTVAVVVGLGHTGDGHRMAEKLGAYWKDLEYVKPTFGMHARGTTLDKVCLMFYSGAIIVNKQGHRFVNESLSYKDLGKAALKQTDGVGFQIFDQKIFDILLEKAKGVLPQNNVFGLDEIKIKLLVKADSIAGMAIGIGVPPDALRQTVDRYNHDVAKGKDSEFGRTNAVGQVGALTPIDKPPFYAYETKGNLPSTYAGIVVDDTMHVLNKKGRIPGLFAAGEIMGGFHGASYMSGTGVGKAVVFGRIAGKAVVKS